MENQNILATLGQVQEIAESLAEKVGGMDYAQKSVVEAVASKVETLEGDDTGKSVRTIANEELAKQLIPENAKESLDTLAELAAWIQTHPDDASRMNEAITTLQAKTALGTFQEGGETKEYTTVKEYVEAMLVAVGGNVDGKVDKEDGKGLSTNDFTDAYKEKLDGIRIATEDEVKSVIEGITIGQPADQTTDQTTE